MANLLKADWVNWEDDTVVIDNSALSDNRVKEARHLDALRKSGSADDDDMQGFSAGIAMESVDPDDEAILSRAYEDGDYEGAEYMPEEGMDAASPEQLDQLTRPQEDAGYDAPPQIDEAALQAQVDEIIANAETQAGQIIAEAQSQAEQLKQSAIAEGLQAGHDEGYQAGLTEVEELKAQVALAKEEQDREYKKMTDSIEADMVDVLTQIYEHVFAVDFKGNKNIIMHLVKSTLSHIEGNSNLIVHVSSDDYDMIIDEKEHLQEMVTNPNVHMEIVEDPLLKENECTIETENGVFDCSVGTELEELSRKLKLLSFERR